MSRYAETVNEIRKFNRFYTVSMGFLDSGYLDTVYSIVETRVLFEIRMRGTCIQSDIAKTLHVDKSYLSRIITRFSKNGIIKKYKSKADKRITYITLTEKGNIEADRLIELTDTKIKSQISQLSSDECEKLCDAMNLIISILGKEE